MVDNGAVAEINIGLICKTIMFNFKVTVIYIFRRLCPDISFFQQATEFPCLPVVNSGGAKRLHRRVEHSVLKSANVERKGLGITRVRTF